MISIIFASFAFAFTCLAIRDARISDRTPVIPLIWFVILGSLACIALAETTWIALAWLAVLFANIHLLGIARSVTL